MLTKEQIENRLKWAEALESGKYKQGYRQLKKYNCYCCLGVACELGIMRPDQGFIDFDVYVDENNIQAETGFTRKELDNFIWLNDENAWSFAQIAEKIRESCNL